MLFLVFNIELTSTAWTVLNNLMTDNILKRVLLFSMTTLCSFPFPFIFVFFPFLFILQGENYFCTLQREILCKPSKVHEQSPVCSYQPTVVKRTWVLTRLARTVIAPALFLLLFFCLIFHTFFCSLKQFNPLGNKMLKIYII